MKIYILFILFLVSCGNNSFEKERIIQSYKEYLLEKNTYEDPFEVFEREGLGQYNFEYLNVNKYNLGDLIEYYHRKGYDVEVDYTDDGIAFYYAYKYEKVK